MPKGQLPNTYGQNYLPNIDARNSANTASPTSGNKTGGPTPPMPTSPPSVILGGGATGPGEVIGSRSRSDSSPRDDKAINDSLRKPGNSADGTPRRTTPESYRPELLRFKRTREAAFAPPPRSRLPRLRTLQLVPATQRSEPATHARRGCRANPEGRQASRPRDTSRTVNRPSRSGTSSSSTGARSAGRGARVNPARSTSAQCDLNGSTAPDGSDMLVLVRAAKVDDKGRLPGRRGRLAETRCGLHGGDPTALPAGSAHSDQGHIRRLPGSGDDGPSRPTRSRPRAGTPAGRVDRPSDRPRARLARRDHRRSRQSASRAGASSTSPNGAFASSRRSRTNSVLR